MTAADQPASGEAQIRRAKASDVAGIVEFLNKVRKEGPRVDRAEVMRSFADKGFMVAELNGELVSVVAWHVENLVACLEEMYIYPAGLRASVGPQMLQAIEVAAGQLMTEAALIFVAPHTPKSTVDMYTSLGYKLTDATTLTKAWREAATSLLKPDMRLLVKQLRESRVTRPI